MKTDDLRIVKIHPLLSPAILAEEVPLTEAAAKVCEARRAIEAILDGHDARLPVVVGPCSIHDTGLRSNTRPSSGQWRTRSPTRC